MEGQQEAAMIRTLAQRKAAAAVDCLRPALARPAITAAAITTAALIA